MGIPNNSEIGYNVLVFLDMGYVRILRILCVYATVYIIYARKSWRLLIWR